MNLAIYLNYNFDKNNPSIRLRRLNLRKPLRKAGVSADIIYRYEDLLTYDNILVSNFNKQILSEIIALRKKGKQIFFCHSENLWNLQCQKEVFNACDYIVCCSTKLAELTQARLTSSFTKCVVISDMVETPRPIHEPKETDKLQIVWVGMGGNSYLAKDIKPIIDDLGMELSIISEHPDADIQWKRETYLYDMAKFDIAICPQNVKLQPAKSCVKVATALRLGLPLVCSPNPAYLEAVEHGVNGFVADNDEEWAAALTELQSFETRKKVSEQALATSTQFEPDSIANKWVELLNLPKPKIAFVNDTLPQKYLSYGDVLLEQIRLDGFSVEEFRYEDSDILPDGFDAYLFIEARCNSDELADVHPRILYTKENTNINHFAHYDAIVTPNPDLAQFWRNRGFVNVYPQENFSTKEILKLAKNDPILERRRHNHQLHDQHINIFSHLLKPEVRWEGGIRDKEHIKYTTNMIPEGSDVLDIGSADGWMTTYLAKKLNCRTAALEFVNRGIAWTQEQAQRLGIHIDLRFGFIEDVDEVFGDMKFDFILAYEILEHLDYLRLPWYLKKMEKLLKPTGKILVSLPLQDLRDNPEYLWSPNDKLIDKMFGDKPEYESLWVDMPGHEIPGGWFISYRKPK